MSDARLHSVTGIALEDTPADIYTQIRAACERAADDFVSFSPDEDAAREKMARHLGVDVAAVEVEIDGVNMLFSVRYPMGVRVEIKTEPTGP